MISLGIDIGGTGCKCVAFQEDGKQLALAYLEYPNPMGNVNLDANVLRESVFSVISQCVTTLPNPTEVAAITVSSFGESFVPVDSQGVPLTDIILYFANSENADFDQLVEAVGAKTFMEITRVLPDASYSLAKILYTEKVAERPVWKYLFVASYIAYCLSGKAACDQSLACRSLLYDVRQHCWSQELVEKAQLSMDQLPTIIEAGTIIGTLLPEVAVQLGLSANVKVVSGCHDQIVNALGAGVHQSGDAVDTSGTCECITPLFSEMPGMSFIENNYACVPYLDAPGYVTYAYNISGGAVVKWYRDALAAHLRQQAKESGCSIYDLLNQVCPTEPTNLLVIPFLQGMGGTPEVDPTATGMVAGLTTSTTLPDLYRAILEGLCFEMRYNLEKLEQGGVNPTRLYACGGGARSRIWLQIKADIWNREIIPVKTEETGALGSAILGFAAVTESTDICSLALRFTQHGDPIQPNPAHRAHYEAQYAKYKKLRAFSLKD